MTDAHYSLTTADRVEIHELLADMAMPLMIEIGQRWILCSPKMQCLT